MMVVMVVVVVVWRGGWGRRFGLGGGGGGGGGGVGIALSALAAAALPPLRFWAHGGHLWPLAPQRMPMGWHQPAAKLSGAHAIDSS